MESQTNVVALIGNQLQQFGLSLLAGHNEKAIEGKIYVIDNGITFETQCLWMTKNPTEKHMIAANITSLQNEQCKQTRLLAKASDTTLMLISPAPRTIIPTPPSHIPAQLSDNTIPPTNPLIPTTPPCLPPAVEGCQVQQPTLNSGLVRVTVSSYLHCMEVGTISYYKVRG